MTDKDKVDTHFNEAMAEFVGQNYDKSIAAFSRALDIDPQNKIVLLSRASAYMKLGRLDEAREEFDRVIENHPDYAKAYHLRGLVNEKSGDNPAALKDFDRAIALDPEYGAAYYSRANLHSIIGNEDRATEDIEMVTHLSNVNIETYANQNNIWRSQHLKLEEAGELTSTVDR
ncbi:MAG: tetratricopeptide repeat protein [Desulfobacterales bacterium]